MNVIIESKYEGHFFIANVNGFDMPKSYNKGIFINFYNGNKYGWGIGLYPIVNLMGNYIKFPEREDVYSYLDKNKKHLNIISEKIFNVLITAYKNNTDIYIIQEIENIVKEYFETQGQ